MDELLGFLRINNTARKNLLFLSIVFSSENTIFFKLTSKLLFKVQRCYFFFVLVSNYSYFTFICTVSFDHSYNVNNWSCCNTSKIFISKFHFQKGWLGYLDISFEEMKVLYPKLFRKRWPWRVAKKFSSWKRNTFFKYPSLIFLVSVFFSVLLKLETLLKKRLRYKHSLMNIVEQLFVEHQRTLFQLFIKTFWNI